MSYRKIQAALDSWLAASAESVIAFPGQPFRPAHNAAYVAVEFRPGPVAAIFLGDGAAELHSGSYRLTLHDPDLINAESRLDALRGHFNRGRILTFEGVEVHLDGASMVADDGDLKRAALPLIIAWRSYF
ncbi:MAG: hypothetical protein CMN55_14130 [Sneathiella sp.]|jgi:hypothetical protein|uniref:phage tail terminator-like protein n=1 Tax=Sneathiella sp. TaxID=1964365 RepID=UPI000C43B13C|nr:phage tail terminator-like protein [Sneathiella sp.]MAL80221.1 hypothetical protein [Sneathiella sp.]|tara:strand:+ start:35 stop:424 length:390 start_codon:yes stop_codon:yes gene_type:complete